MGDGNEMVCQSQSSFIISTFSSSTQVYMFSLCMLPFTEKTQLRLYTESHSQDDHVHLYLAQLFCIFDFMQDNSMVPPLRQVS